MNIKLLEKVANAILDEPRKFDMGSWAKPSDLSPCGTACCIAGHAVAIGMALPSLQQVDVMDDNDMFAVARNARALIGSSDLGNLFHLDDWPIEFRHAYWSATREERGEVGFWRIQHFIATEGRE
jgi:hypothetical protein